MINMEDTMDNDDIIENNEPDVMPFEECEGCTCQCETDDVQHLRNSMTIEILYSRVKSLVAKGIPKSKIQIIMTKETIEQLVGQEIKFYDVKPGQNILAHDMRFGGFRVYLGVQDKIQVVESEIWI